VPVSATKLGPPESVNVPTLSVVPVKRGRQ
jgi:hypothetical protein